jgi:hypothetical protein
MNADMQRDRQETHALIDLLPPGKLGAVRNLLEAFLGEDGDSLSSAEAKAIHDADEWSKRHEPIAHENVLAEFGLTTADWEQMSRERE